ncbi:hypothetical protein CKO28_01645 [Rhodovibrio sodomensis]|uniref:Lysozyme inhibitor LprI N-terminal domain-containing protein n=1 Tax=Rhodovibrio sodomensis TaxID=1088 RepID=A0ABS1D8L1_9PROT|nr:hypothetical protein [Rhodovibrio sodomensis]MBK1666747.1 hypothetical protein [Rhodovibrio sodomensis]
MKRLIILGVAATMFAATLPALAQSGDARTEKVNIEQLDDRQRDQVGAHLTEVYTKVLRVRQWIAAAAIECQRITPDQAAEIRDGWRAWQARNEDFYADTVEVIAGSLVILTGETRNTVDTEIEGLEEAFLDRSRRELRAELAGFGTDQSEPVQNYCTNSIQMMTDPVFNYSRDSDFWAALQPFRHYAD